MSCGTCGLQASDALQGDTGVPAGAPTTASRPRCPRCHAFIAAAGATCKNPRCPTQQVAAAPPPTLPAPPPGARWSYIYLGADDTLWVDGEKKRQQVQFAALVVAMRKVQPTGEVRGFTAVAGTQVEFYTDEQMGLPAPPSSVVAPSSGGEGRRRGTGAGWGSARRQAILEGNVPQARTLLRDAEVRQHLQHADRQTLLGDKKGHVVLMWREDTQVYWRTLGPYGILTRAREGYDSSGAAADAYEDDLAQRLRAGARLYCPICGALLPLSSAHECAGSVLPEAGSAEA